ncbi:MAG TPA: class I SAM-dependent methyltransferase [Pilimelia sp.]|nr:class I SAM-dependent methyltransferase [Pilimelia sp.]
MVATKKLDLIDDDLYRYAVTHTSGGDALIAELVTLTRARFGDRAGMQVSPEQATLLGLLAGLVGARRAVEVGTFTGLSSLAIARAMPADGHLLCLDISAEYTAVAQEFWARAGVAERIELRLGPAAPALAALPAEPHLDLAFIDADKTGYSAYWAEIVPRVRPGGLIIVDNVLWSGRVLAPEPGDADTMALTRFNDEVSADDRVDSVMLIVADGLTLARKR